MITGLIITIVVLTVIIGMNAYVISGLVKNQTKISSIQDDIIKQLASLTHTQIKALKAINEPLSYFIKYNNDICDGVTGIMRHPIGPGSKNPNKA